MSSEILSAFERLSAARRAAPYPSLAARHDWLDRLDRMLTSRAEAFATAIDADFGGRSRHESLMADVMLTLDTIRASRRNVRTWMARRPATASPYFLPSRAYVEPIPRGVVAIISPWNYPVNLALAPLAAALAAGNRAILKPSELTPKTSALLGRAVRETFSADEVVVLEGGADVARAVSELPLDHLFFTGSTAVGRLVAQAAAKNLVPVTLELGGKSPALVAPGYPIGRAAERIAIGKLFNAGQTCIAPDYALVPIGQERELAEALKAAARAAYPSLASGQYSSVVSDRHLARIEGLLEDARQKGATIEPLFPSEPAVGRRMPPVIVFGVKKGMAIAEEEIFGPVLPITGYDSVDAAVATIGEGPKPLAFYYFDEDLDRAEDVLQRVHAGGVTVNDTLVHFAQEHLPFGGVGASGMGAYHGVFGFDTFSHLRGTLVASALSPARQLQSPPYGRALDLALGVLVKGLPRP